MRCVFLAFLLTVLSAPAIAQSKAEGPNTQVAYLQAHNIYTSGLTGTHTIALTFDDGPNFNTLAVLDALKVEKVKATFFIVGKMAAAHPDVLRRIAAEGHLLANHSADHALLGKRYVRHPELLFNELRQVDDEIAPLMPTNALFFFRAPYGSWRPAEAALLNADPDLKKYIGPIYWDEGGNVSLDKNGYVLSSADWDCWRRKWEATICAKGYLREIRRKNGGVVLIHCISGKAAELVQDIVPALEEEGYSFVRVDQVPTYRQYETPPPTDAEPVIASAGNSRIATASR